MPMSVVPTGIRALGIGVQHSGLVDLWLTQAGHCEPGVDNAQRAGAHERQMEELRQPATIEKGCEVEPGGLKVETDCRKAAHDVHALEGVAPAVKDIVGFAVTSVLPLERVTDF